MNNLITISIILFNEDKYINDIKLINETWGKICNDLQIEYVFFIKNIIDENCITLNTDNYYNEIFNWFNNKQYSFIFICFSNAFINIYNLINYIKCFETNKPLYIGGHGDYRIIDNIKFYFHSYQPGIILSKIASDLLINYDIEEYNQLCNINNETLINNYGVSLGYFAQKLNFDIVDNINIHYCNYRGAPCHHGKINQTNIISCYHMSNHNFIDYYNIINKNNLKLTNINLKMDIYIIPCGGLGNILFQYFFGFSLKKKYNCNIYFAKDYGYWRGEMNQYQIFQHLDYFDYNDKNLIKKLKKYDEPNSLYNEIVFDTSCNYLINGYFQSYKYFINYIEDIKIDLFSNVSDLYNDVLNNYNNIEKNNKKTCLIHVRRGDYLKYPDIHPLCDEKYYLKGIDIFKNSKFLIFSDDIPYIENWKIIKNLDYEIIYETNPEKTLIFMSLCDNFIIANSSLSLTSFYLRKNRNAKLVAPAKWFGSGGVNFNIRDIVPYNTTFII
jgi:hypothetical protein